MLRIPRLRITISRMMTVVLLAALACAALARAAIFEPSIWWASLLYTFDLFAFAGAGVVALFGRGRRQSAAGGASLFGGLYLVTVFGVGSDAITNDVWQPPLITTGILNRIAPKDRDGVLTLEVGRRGEPFHTTSLPQLFPTLPPGSARVVSLPEYRRVGHCLFALAFASIGGLIGLRSRPSLVGPPGGTPRP